MPVYSLKLSYSSCSGNHERDCPGTGSFYDGNDSGGECGVLAETMYYVPAENRAKFWYENLISSPHSSVRLLEWKIDIKKTSNI